MLEKLRYSVSAFVSIIINMFGKNPEGTAEKILLIRLDHMGDMVYTFEAIRNLRREYRDSKISLITGAWNSELFINSPLIDSVVIYNSPSFARKKDEVTCLADRFALSKSLKKMNFDLVVSFRDDFFTIFLSLFLLPRFRRDVGTIRILTKVRKLMNMFSNGVAFPKHEMDINKEAVLPLVSAYEHGGNFFRFTPEEEEWAEKFFEANNLRRKAYAIIHPGAFWRFRRWDYHRFREVGSFIFDRFGLRSVIIGSSEESEIGSKICEDYSSKFVNIIGITSLRKMIILIANAAITVCNDSGPMHLSSQLGTITICLLGPAEIQRFGPRGDRVVYFHKRVECWPCKQITCKHPELPCVNLTSASEVIDAIQNELA